MPPFHRFYPKGSHRRGARHRLALLITLLLAISSSILLRPAPAAAQAGLICVNKTTPTGLGSNQVNGVYADGSTVYAATYFGLSISTNGGASFTNKLPSEIMLGVYASGSTVYAATDSGGVNISTDGGANFTSYTTVNGLGSNALSGVYASGSTVYAATLSGLSISTNGGTSFTNYTTANGLGDDWVRDVYASGSTIYAATQGGLSISTDGGTSFTNKTTANGLGTDAVSGVYANGSTVYAATGGGLGISTDGGANFTTYTTANGLGSNAVNDVYASGSTIYAATESGLSISTDGGANFTTYTTANGLGHNFVYGVYASGSTIYAATDNGLTICTPPVSQVQGNGVTIASGDTTPSTADGTDFGGTTIGSSLVQSFTINNTGDANLTSVAVTLSGSSAFSVSDPPATTISPGSSSTFTVTFAPTTNSVVMATVNFTSNRDPYTFVVQGGVTAPGAALAFDGDDDYVTLPASLNNGFGANRITLEGWFYPTVQPGANQYFMWIGEAYTSDNNVKFAIYQEGANLICGFYQNGWNATNGVAVTLNAWQHVACSYDQQNIKLYVNGAIATSAAATAALPTGDGAWYLGRRWDGADYYAGRMDEVRIWNRALLASEIANRMNCEPGGDLSGLVARYGFNQGTALANNSGVTTLTDSSSNALNGMLTYFALSGSTSNWSAPGSTASGVACVTAAPEIDVRGNGVSIASGDNTPSSADGSNFGSIQVGSTPVTHTFTISNSGAETLNLSGSPRVALSGNSAFSVNSQPAGSSVAAGGSSTFQIAFAPTASGVVTALVSIANDDSNENPYTFVVGGTGATPGAALAFDGVDDYVTLPASLNNQFAANRITVEGWFYPTAQPGANQYFTWIGEAYTSDANVKFAIYQFGANVICGFYQNGWSATPGVAVTLNGWQHVACTYDQQNIKLYVNGAVAATAAASAALPSGDGDWYLGRRWDGADYYKGRMDEVRIWNRALSASEIADRMNCEPGGNPSGLVARYGFNQGNAPGDNSGVTSLTDSSSNAINGTLTGFALSGSASNWVAPGSAASGVACATAPEIDVQGNGVSISSGDTTPITADDSNFGRQTTGNTVAHTFTINNSGAAALTGVAVTLNGSSAFQLTATPASSVAAGGSSNFTLSFTPSAVGAYTATVNIASNDSNENPYTFVVQGIWTDSNIAVSQSATQSSTYPDDCTGPASKAVDGNTSGNASACSFSTTNNQPQDWWQVDLGAAYLIQGIDIWNRTDCCGERLSNFDLLVSTDGSNWTTFYYPGTAATTTSFVINGVGRYVKVQLRGQNYLSLAEVQVWGTPSPEIDVSGNGMSIASGDSTPSTSDDTDFGRLTTSGTVAHIFTLYNSGTAALTGVTATLNGDSAFSLTSTPASSMGARDSSSFTIEFTPSAVGAYTATVSIASNDSDENPYTFVVQGIWTGSNIAIGQPATQSSTYNDPCTGPASNAVDGNTAGDPGSCSFSTTNNENPQDWWQVDLGAAYLIQVIDLWNRTDCCGDRLSNFDLLVSTDGANWTTFYYPDTAPTTTSFVINAPVRYVKVQLRGQNYLTLAEVQVWGPALPEIDVQGNGASIANGDSTPATADHTSFGKLLPGGSMVRSFTIRNSGAATLALSGSPVVAISGDSAFTVSSQPAGNSLAANGSVPFTITFAPNAVGFVTATVSIANDDGNENPYTFVVGGAGVTANAQLNGVGCLLIDAINAANSDAASGSCPAGSGADSITLLQDVTLSVVDNADYNNTGANGLPQISSAITVEGGGHTISRTASAPAFRLFFVADGGNLTLNNLTLSNGDVTPSSRSGGALYNAYGGTATVNNSTISGNSGYSGGIANYGDLTVNQSTVSGNTATGNGGGLENWGTLTVNDSTVSGNNAGANGGGLYNGRTLTVTNSTISDNGGSSGGGLYNWGKLTVINSTVSGNRSGSGGGLNNEYGGRALVNNSTFAANAAVGIGSGGGIRNDSSSKMTVNNSTLSANTAGNGAGGILNGGTMTVTNSTLSANAATYGGGLANSGTLTLNNSTLSGNTAISGNGGGINNFGPLTLKRTLIAGNSATGGGPEIYVLGGTVTANSYNLIGYGGDARSSGFTPGATDIVPSGALATILNTTLADNGGGTQTLALVPGSPALDAAGDSGLATDQRGVTRPQGAADDIGAFELEPAPEIDVQGNGVSITNGDSTPAAADHTDFGSVAVGSAVTRTFTISNGGAAALTGVAVTANGSSAFAVTTAPAATVNAGATTSFALRLAPTVSGTLTATVSIASNDSNENPYTFVVSGAAVSQLNNNDQVTQQSFTALYQPTPQSCGGSLLPTHTLTPTLRNTTSESYRGLYFVVTELRYSAAQGGLVPTLCNADGGNGGGVGARLTVADATLGDGILAPSESFAQPIQVGLPVRARYRVFVDLYGRPASVAAADGNTGAVEQAATHIGVLRWEFDENGTLVDSRRQLFLPLVNR